MSKVKNVEMKFYCAYDYLDFDFYLNLIDPCKNYCVNDVEKAYVEYIELRNEASKADCEDFREFLVYYHNLSLEYSKNVI